MTKEFYIGLKVETELGEKIKKLAEEDRRNMSDYIRGILLDHVKMKSC